MLANTAARLLVPSSLAVALLVAPPALGSRKPFSFEQSGTLSSGTKYSVKIAESQYQRGFADLPDDGSWWGIDGGFPDTYCTTFQVVIDGKPVTVVRKLYQDLSQLNRVKLDDRGGHLVVLIEGGDAAGSFQAEFFFREFEVERVVRGGEFPHAFWERTILHNSLSAEAE